MSPKWFQSDPGRAPDSDFDRGELHHLCVGNHGRLLDFRRTPVCVREISYETGLAAMEIMAFEDRGAVWDVEFERVNGYQFAKDGTKASDGALREIRSAIERFNTVEVVSADDATRLEAFEKLDRERATATDWLNRHSRFIESGRPLPVAEAEGSGWLYDDLRRYMIERRLDDVERRFTRRYISYPFSEDVKAHRIAIARLGLASYRGKILRDASKVEDPLSFERRGKHVLARMGWVQALLGRFDMESVVLYRMESCEGNLRERQRQTALISASFRMDIVQEMSGWADLERSVALYRQAVPIERLVMTYMETEAMNHPFREAEAVLLTDPSNPAF